MRFKVLISVLALGGVALGLVFFLWLSAGPRTTPAPSGDPTAASTQPPDSTAKNSELAMKPVAPADAAVEVAKTAVPNATNQAAAMDDDDPLNPSPEAKHRAYVVARVNELEEMGSADDLDSLNTLLSELSNRDPEIRKAALEAIVQFDSLDAIPKLEDAELQADDPYERADIAKAIDFIKLPSITDVLPRRGGAR